MKLQIACIPGDGIGPEIVAQANKVLDQVAKKFGHEIERKEILMGGASIDVHGVPLTDEAIATAKAADAVLMGSIGGDTNTSPLVQAPSGKASGSRSVEDPQSTQLICKFKTGLFVSAACRRVPVKRRN